MGERFFYGRISRMPFNFLFFDFQIVQAEHATCHTVLFVTYFFLAMENVQIYRCIIVYFTALVSLRHSYKKIILRFSSPLLIMRLPITS